MEQPVHNKTMVVMDSTEVTMDRPLKIAFYSPYDPGNPNVMSGLPYQARRSLAQHNMTVDVFHPITPPAIKVGRLLHRLYGLFGQAYEAYNNVIVSRILGHCIQKTLASKNYDFAFVSFGHTMMAHLRSECPIVVMTDATWRLLRDYPFTQGMSQRTWAEVDLIEQRALCNASLVIYSSRWAMESAICDYGCDPAKVYVLPFGPNLETAPEYRQAVTDRLMEKRWNRDRCRLLFLGRDWERKGGDIALETVTQLNQAGLPAHLTICGCVPPKQSHISEASEITIIPNLDKTKPDEVAQLNRLLLDADFLLLPTRADCTPLVFSEASAFGLPVVTTDVGGVSGVIVEGINGTLLSIEAKGDAYADRISQIFQDRSFYYQLVQSSRQYYEDELNWDSWGQKMRNILCTYLTDVTQKQSKWPKGSRQ